MHTTTYLPILLSLTVLGLAVSEAHALSPHAQYESGIPIEEILCPDGMVLLESPRGTPACVTERSVEKLVQRGFEIVERVVDQVESAGEGPTVNDAGAPQESTGAEPQDDAVIQAVDEEPQTVTLQVSSPVEFVDDGRKYERALQRTPPPQKMYDVIMDGMTMEKSGMIVGQSGNAAFSTVEHEKYSINPGVGFYAEDWLPTYIPDGYKLLYGGTQYETWPEDQPEYEEYKVYFRFMPKNFVLHKDVTNQELDNSKGFWIEAVKTTEPLVELEDRIEAREELLVEEPVWYGGFRDMERDGKTVYAFEGGNKVNPHRSIISWYFADDAYISILSNYLTLDEIIPIFESMKN